jgi:hypothetical protein
VGTGAECLVKRDVMADIRRTVEATAAGTLKITLMIWFRSSTMNTVARRLAKNLKMTDINNQLLLIYGAGKCAYAMMKKIKPSSKIIFAILLAPKP